MRAELAAALLLALALPAAAAPDASSPASAHPGAASPSASSSSSSIDALRADLARQLDGEADAIERARTAVADKRALAERTRAQRLRAAYRQLERRSGDDALAVARRRAAARLLLDRDAEERRLLVDEAATLATERAAVDAQVPRIARVALPGPLTRPAAGKIARGFGLLAHEKSKATLSRRGIDLEVDDRAPVVAPAAGTVRYAGPIRGLDHGVVLDHGGFTTVVAKLGELALPVGTALAAGDRLGRAARHRVYLEVRVKLGPGGIPIDPAPLLP